MTNSDTLPDDDTIVAATCNLIPALTDTIIGGSHG